MNAPTGAVFQNMAPSLLLLFSGKSDVLECYCDSQTSLQMSQELS